MIDYKSYSDRTGLSLGRGVILLLPALVTDLCVYVGHFFQATDKLAPVQNVVLVI